MTAAADLLAAATVRLRAAGVPSAQHDAEQLLAHCAGVPRNRIRFVTDVSADVAERFDQSLERRAAREPLQHVVGTAPFRHLELAVGPGVFVPRPETELLVDAAAADLSGRAHPVVVDLCAGSGALGLAVVDEFPGATVHALERSESALHWLRRNAARSAITVVAGDVTDPDCLAHLDCSVDVVLSNPPYVPDGTAIDAEVHRDPSEAVFAGPDGLGLIPAVVDCAVRLLSSGGLLVMEHDITHALAVPALLRADPRWDAVTAHQDLTGRPRFVTARRAAAGTGE